MMKYSVLKANLVEQSFVLLAHQSELVRVCSPKGGQVGLELGDMCALFRDHGQRPIIVGLVANFLTWKK
jgi:hypothetical protein